MLIQEPFEFVFFEEQLRLEAFEPCFHAIGISGLTQPSSDGDGKP